MGTSSALLYLRLTVLARYPLLYLRLTVLARYPLLYLRLTVLARYPLLYLRPEHQTYDDLHSTSLHLTQEMPRNRGPTEDPQGIGDRHLSDTNNFIRA